MKYLIQFLIILVFSFVGELLRYVVPLPVPASIYGIILMFAAFKIGVLKVSHVKETALFLIEIMPLMFVPAAVGLIDSWDILRPAWGEYVVAIVLSTIVVMGVSGIVTQMVIKKSNKNERVD
jgi:holin-like protein